VSMKRTVSIARTHGIGGYTLLELVVAVGISVLILVMVVRLLGVVLGQVGRSVDGLGRQAEGSWAQAALVEDLQSMLTLHGWSGATQFHSPGDGWGSGGWDAVQVEGKPSETVVAYGASPSDGMEFERWGREGLQAAWLIQDPRMGRHDPGGIKAVAYQIQRMRLHPEAFPRYYLTRSEVSAYQTVQQGYNLDQGDYAAGNGVGDAFWSASVLRRPGPRHVIASQVIDFGMRGFARDARSGRWGQVFPAPGGMNGRVPEMWAGFVRVLSEEGAQQIENLEQGRTAGDWWQVAVEHSELLTFRVTVPR
jgi:hypothetical protein